MSRWLLALGFSMSMAAASMRQAPAVAALTPTLRAHVEAERLDMVTSVRGLPLDVRYGLERIFGGSLDIAEPGAEFQTADVKRYPRLPIRRLISAGCSIDHCLIYYERGGIAQSWFVVLFHWTPSNTTFEWGGAAPSGLRNIAEVRKAVLSGAIKTGNRSW